MAELIGAMLITGMITLALMKLIQTKWNKGLSGVIAANVISVIIVITIGSFGFGDISYAATLYGSAQIVVLGLSILVWKGRQAA